MKKAKPFLILTMAVLVSCAGAADPDADAQKMCELVGRAQQYKQQNNRKGLDEVTEEMKRLSDRMDADYKDNKAAIDRIKAKVHDCSGTLME